MEFFHIIYGHTLDELNHITDDIGQNGGEYWFYLKDSGVENEFEKMCKDKNLYIESLKGNYYISNKKDQ